MIKKILFALLVFGFVSAQGVPKTFLDDQRKANNSSMNTYLSLRSTYTVDSTERKGEYYSIGLIMEPRVEPNARF